MTLLEAWQIYQTCKRLASVKPGTPRLVSLYGEGFLGKKAPLRTIFPWSTYLFTSRTCEATQGCKPASQDGKADIKHSSLRWSPLCCSQPSLAAESLFPGLPFIAFALHVTLVSKDVGHLRDWHSLYVACLLGRSITTCRWANVLPADTTARSLKDIKPWAAYNWSESSEIWFLSCPWSSINWITSFLINIQDYSSSFSRDLKFKSMPSPRAVDGTGLF